ncbi:Cobalt-zinc-cadmium resistance protein CzcD [hydrothermal vent metagenome]|uniref:Cobalt-zinc-cadmium resistance protein CzcD n=1 Tax=hydrothermal vent metagenome TaxID=652676 RepID=A0A3B0SGH7_9ZZZZ
MRMGSDHNHIPKGAGEGHLRVLSISFVLIFVFMVAEVIGGIVTQSLALLSDAGHMVTDAIGLAMAIAAIRIGLRTAQSRGRTYGLRRLEVLAALANAVMVFGVAAYVLWEALKRLRDPVEVGSSMMLIIAILGLIVNIIAMKLLRESSQESINVEGAYLEVWADTIGSVGVIFAAVVIRFTGWQVVDPLIGVGIAIFIVPRAWRLGRKAVKILLQIAPDHIDVDDVRSSLEGIEDVTGIHKLHIWTISTGENVVSAHITVTPEGDHHEVLDIAADVLETKYGITNTTVQVEPPDHTVCTEDD